MAREVVLSPTQTRVVTNICDILLRPGVVELLGLSGVGKTLVAKAASLQSDQVHVVELKRGETFTPTQERTIIIRSHELLAPESNQIILPGMSVSESEQMLNNIKVNRNRRTSIINSAYGIPLLMSRLAKLPPYDPSNNTVDFLRKAMNFGYPIESQVDLLNRHYLQIPYPPNFQSAFMYPKSNDRNKNPSRIIDEAINRFREAGKQDNLSFVSPESYSIYSNSVAGRVAQLTIAIPDFDTSLVNDLDTIMGVGRTTGGWGVTRIPRSRAALFGMDERKVNYLVQYARNNWRNIHAEGAPWSSGSDQTDIDESIKIQFSGSEREILKKGRMILFSAQDHDRMCHNPIAMGLTVETWLQQAGIKYFANNHMVEKKYFFEPKTKEIKYF